MSSKRVRNLFNKFGRAKSQSTTDLSEWSKSDEKLMKAVEGQDVKKVSSILSKKAMVPSKLGPRGQSIFHVACALGNSQIVDLLLKETDDVNDLTIQGNTCLQLAAAKGHEQVVQRLMQSGAEVDMRDSNDMTALHHACAGLHYGCVHALLQGGADPRCTEKGGKTPLFYAAHRGEISICKLLVDKGADVNAGDKMQITPLMVAAKEGKRDACEFLLKRGANPNTADREGHTAMYYVAVHPHLKEVFANAPAQASWNLKSPGGESNQAERDDRSSVNSVNSVKERPSLLSQVSAVSSFTPEATPPAKRPASAVQSYSAAGSDVEALSQSEDESPTLHRTSDPSGQTSQGMSPRSKDTQAYKELEAEHEQLSEEYNTLSIENLRLRDKLEFLQQRMNGKHEQGNAGKEVPQEMQEEIRNLKSMLEEEKERSKELEKHLSAKASEGGQVSAEVSGDTDSWHDSDEDEAGGDSSGKKIKGKDMGDKQMVAMLRSQILTLRQENEQLRNNAQEVEKSAGDATDGRQQIAALEAERQELRAEIFRLKENATSHKLSGAVEQEQLVQNNSQLQAEVETLRSTLQVVEEEKAGLQQQVVALEEEKAALPSDKLAVMNSAKVMEEVKFDEEGFVEGQDLTKEEFLQAQNEQLKLQCGLLTEELTKLRSTFDAILKAGDNLQADYDQQQAEKEKLHDQLEVVLREKEEVVKENEFLLSDGNALHDDLRKLVLELEKMQEKYRTVCAEKEQLQHQHNAVTIAGKVGEVARLLEEREKLQGRLQEAEETAGRLTHDQAILLEEVQSQQERMTALVTERDALQAEMEDAEALVAQNEALTQECAQLELDYNELMKEKEGLEAGMQQQTEGDLPSEASPEVMALREERDLLMAERDQLELTIQELSRENAGLEEELDTIRARLKDKGGNTAVEAAKLEEKVKELSKENAELEEELANTQDHIASLEAKLEAATMATGDDGDVEMWKASVTQLETTVSELSRENASLEEELESVKAQLDRSQEALENRLLLEGITNPAANATIATLQQEKQSMAEELERLQQRVSQSSSINGEVEASAASPMLNNNVKEKGQLLQTIGHLQLENSRLQEEMDRAQAKLATMKEDVGQKGAVSVNGTMGEQERISRMDVQHFKEQVTQLQQQLTDLEELHKDTINTYRTHLLSAVQGHMDPEVKEALHNIIEMRSMEQFC
ncbi:uncharacterized protein LOC143297221 isoform X2 [Babylonia areolata]|uniref:uncharacterized protein LOC143297221 isoform X2 n=1 Tax=Babylonia areolata TaxID=304850 RepID=UPI003FD4C1CA